MTWNWQAWWQTFPDRPPDYKKPPEFWLCIGLLALLLYLLLEPHEA